MLELSTLCLTLQLAAPQSAAPCPSPLPEPAKLARGSRIHWAEVERACEPELELSLDWILLQLVPSPELGIGDEGAAACAGSSRPRSIPSPPIDPGEALLAIHFDTFVNSLDEYGEAPRALRASLSEHGLDEERVAVLQHGEQRVFLLR